MNNPGDENRVRTERSDRGGGGGMGMDRGDRGGDRGGRDDRGGDRGEKRGFQRRKGCRFCAEPGYLIDFKDKYLIQTFVTERFKIVPRRISGNCATHQRELTTAIKRARHIAIVPYTTAQN